MNMPYITDIISPLCITNYDNTADLLYDNLPCHSNSFLRCPNSVIEKSDANDACIPSFPTMPMPTSASSIIPTSLPPSPTPAIRLPFVYFLRSQHILAFQVGLHLHTQTQGALIASSKNCSSQFSFFRIVSSVFPSMINTVDSILGALSLMHSSTCLQSSISRINCS